MTLRNVPNSYTLEQQRQEINLMAVDLDTAVDGVQTFTGDKTFADDISLTGGSNAGISFYDGATFYGRLGQQSNNRLELAGQQELHLSANGDIEIKDRTWARTRALFKDEGSVELYFQEPYGSVTPGVAGPAVKKFETTDAGVSVIGTLAADGVTVAGDISFRDGDQALFGTDNDMSLYHSGLAGFLENGTGDLYLRSGAASAIHIEPAAGVDSIVANAGSSVELYYNAVKKFETTSTGVTVSGDVVIDIGTENAILFGSSNELYIRNTDGTGGGGAVNIQGRSGASLWTGTSQLAVAANSSGAGVLYYQSAEKLAATNTGVSITGNIDSVTDISASGDVALADDKVLNFGASSDGRISYTSSTNRFYVRTPGGSADLILGAGPAVRITNEDGLTDRAVFNATGLTVTGTVDADSIVKTGGVSTEFLKADGTVDSSTYLTTETDPVVAAINGIVKSDGTTISAAVAGTDYIAALPAESYTKFGTSTTPNPGIASTSVGSYILDEAQTSDIETSFSVTSGYTKALITLNAMIWNVTDGTTEALVEIERSIAGGAYSRIGTFIFPVANSFYGAMNFTLLDTHGGSAGNTISYKLKNATSIANGYSDASIRLVTGTCGDTFGVREIA